MYAISFIINSATVSFLFLKKIGGRTQQHTTQVLALVFRGSFAHLLSSGSLRVPSADSITICPPPDSRGIQSITLAGGADVLFCVFNFLINLKVRTSWCHRHPTRFFGVKNQNVIPPVVGFVMPGLCINTAGVPPPLRRALWCSRYLARKEVSVHCFTTLSFGEQA